jgi:serine/threonine-protein kinase
MAEGGTRGIRLLAGRYEIGALIGQGGMADVHVGTDARLGRRVAIKLLKPSLASDPAFRSRFRREAQDAAKMAHPTIVRVFDAGEESVLDPETGRERQVPFIVMEFVDGRLLSDLIAETGPMDPHQAAGILGQLLTALEYSHRAGLVHRDIKPGNVMITSTGQVKVMDFGIARAITETSSTIAETSMIVGTAQYFSPEQARGETVDARTDLYSAGVVLFEMLAGRAPFVGANPVAVAYQHVNQQAVRPSVVNPRVSIALDAVVMRAMAKDRGERFQTAAEFRAALEAVDAGTVQMKRPAVVPDFTTTLFGVNPSSTSGTAATVRQLTVDDSTRGARSSSSRPPVAWIWGGIAITIVIVVAVVYWTLNLSAAIIPNTTSVAVPDVVGQSFEQAADTLSTRSLLPRELSEPSSEYETGVVLRTDPAAGSTVPPDSEVRVYVSSGAEVTQVPTITNLKVKAAKKALIAAGFTVDGKPTTAHSPTVAAGVVMGSSPASGSDAEVGSSVSLIVSDGTVDVPSVVGENIADASLLLQGTEYQLEVDQVPDMSCSGGAVQSQSLVGVQEQHAQVAIVYCAAASAPTTED